MIQIEIPGKGPLEIEHVVFDYNGTIAKDGQLADGVRHGINAFSDQLTFHVITADTFGSVEKQLKGLDVVLTVISSNDQDLKKQQYIEKIGPGRTLSAGNGLNDTLMLEKAAIGIAVLGEEGAATSALLSSDLVVRDIRDVFAYFKTPQRLIATLRK